MALSPRTEGLLLAVAALAVLVAALALGAPVVVLAVGAAVLGAWLQNYRLLWMGAGEPAKIGLADPLAGLRGQFALPAVMVAGLLALAAVAVLTLPEPHGETAAATTARAVAPLAAEAPPVRVLEGELGRPCEAGRPSFAVMPGGAAEWAREIVARPAGDGQAWVTLAVTGHSVGARELDPALLPYRLRDDGGTQYHPDVSGGLGATGDGSGEARLGFRVPEGAAGLELVFEPRPDGPLQARVPLG